LDKILPKKKEMWVMADKETKTLQQSYKNEGYFNGYNQAITDCKQALLGQGGE
jgi:hypothetical protein